MIASESSAREVLEGILSEVGDMGGDLGDMFRLVVGTAIRACAQSGDQARPMVNLPIRGGLAVWQLRRAQALMLEALAGPLSVTRVARECGLSHSHFSRAFKLSVGVSPYQWLCGQRVDRAKWLLINTDQTLLEVASSCGFSEQCHFTRMFSRLAGMTPGVWRRVFSVSNDAKSFLVDQMK